MLVMRARADEGKPFAIDGVMHQLLTNPTMDIRTKQCGRGLRPLPSLSAVTCSATVHNSKAAAVRECFRRIPEESEVVVKWLAIDIERWFGHHRSRSLYALSSVCMRPSLMAQGAGQLQTS